MAGPPDGPLQNGTLRCYFAGLSYGDSCDRYLLDDSPSLVLGASAASFAIAIAALLLQLRAFSVLLYHGDLRVGSCAVWVWHMVFPPQESETSPPEVWTPGGTLLHVGGAGGVFAPCPNGDKSTRVVIRCWAQGRGLSLPQRSAHDRSRSSRKIAIRPS